MTGSHTNDRARGEPRERDRAQALDFAAQRGVRITNAEAELPMDDLRKIIFDRFSALYDLLESAAPQGGYVQ